MARIYTENECAAWRKQHYGNKSDQSLEDRHEEWWYELPLVIQELAIAYLRAHLPEKVKEEIWRKFASYGNNWMDHMWEDELDPEIAEFYSFHFSDGMTVRNLLRKVIADDELPSGNWDDFYIAALLRARS